jgi:hypothetical protein
VILPNVYTREQVDTANAELARLEELQSAGPASKGGRNNFGAYTVSWRKFPNSSFFRVVTLETLSQPALKLLVLIQQRNTNSVFWSLEGFRTQRIYALSDKSRAFDCFPIHDTVWKLNEYFLQPNFLMTSYHTVVINPGEREQEIHTDDGLIHLPRPRPLMGIVS